jgi:mannosyltransferase
MVLVPPAVTLAVTLCGITGPSYTPDESATLSAVHRSFPDLIYMIGKIDAVHGAYYVVMWLVVRVVGTSELATRLPSALAMAAAAAVTAAIGRRLVSRRAGLAAGLVFAVLPEVSFYAADARPYALMTLFVTLASYALVRVLQARPGRRRDWLVGYGLFLTLAGLAQVFALLLVAAHAVTVAVSCRASRAVPGRWSLIAGWLTAALAAGVVSGPLVYLGYQQRKSLDTIRSQRVLSDVVETFGSGWTLAVLCAVVAAGIAVSMITDRSLSRWPGALLTLCLPWALVPPVVLLIASHVTPVYAVRYVLYCLPALALLAGAALDAMGLVGAAVGFLVIVLFVLPDQVHVREASGHGRDIRAADRIIAEHYRSGDAVLYDVPATQYERYAYPYGLAQLKTIQIAKTPAVSGTLTGTDVRYRVVSQRLAQVSRVWVLGGGHGAAVNAGIAEDDGFRLFHSWQTGGVRIRLYRR